MNPDRFFNILIGTVLASFVAYLVSGVFHAIWLMGTRQRHTGQRGANGGRLVDTV